MLPITDKFAFEKTTTGDQIQYLVLAVGGSVELQEGTGGVVWAAGVKHAVDVRYRRNTLVEKKERQMS